MTTCDVCGNTSFSRRLVEEVFNLDGHLIMVEGIPARVCTRCGDVTFDRKTTEDVRRMVHGKARPTRRVELDVFSFS